MSGMVPLSSKLEEKMKLQPLPLVVVLAFLTPSLAFSQSQQLTNCHTPESAGNFVGPDETIVNGMVCKIVKPQPAQQQLAVNQPAPPVPGGRNQPTSGEGSGITNARVIEMSKLGLDDDIVIAKIKNGSCDFQLGDTDLVDLKKAGVSPKVIAAMLDAGALTSPRVLINKNEVPIHTMGQAKVGGRIGHDLTVGIKSVKEKAYLDGPHSTIVASSNPVIEIALPKGDTIDNYILVQMDGKGDRRELEVEARGGIVGGKNGIRAEAIHKTYLTPLGGNKFQLGTDTLKKGEYIVYLVGSPDSVKGIYGKGYDFTVQ
jgi:hypothetical protein